MKRIAHLAFLVGLIALPVSLVAGDTSTHRSTRRTRTHVQESASAQQHITHLQHGRRAAHVSTVSMTTRRGHVTHASLAYHAMETLNLIEKLLNNLIILIIYKLN